MDEQAIHRAMNEGARQLALLIRPTDPGSWTRLLAHATSRSWEGAELVSLLAVAYEIGHEDGESEAEAYPATQDEQGRDLLCPKCGGPWSEGYPQQVLDG